MFYCNDHLLRNNIFIHVSNNLLEIFNIKDKKSILIYEYAFQIHETKTKKSCNSLIQIFI
jgi:hypothetical protein